MPESGGLAAEVAVEAVRTLAATITVVGYGATAMNFQNGGDAERTVDVAARIAAVALA